MMARAHWFGDEEPVDGAEADETDEAAEAGAEEHERANV